MENKVEVLKILSDVLGFNCANFGEVMANGIMDGKLYTTKEEAEVACKKIRALAEMLFYHDKSFKVYFEKEAWFDKNISYYMVANDEEFEQLPDDMRPVLAV